MPQSKQSATAWLKGVLNPPQKSKEYHKRTSLVAKFPLVPVYIFTIPDQASKVWNLLVLKITGWKRLFLQK